MKDLTDISLVTQVSVFHNKRAFDRLVVKYQSSIRRFFMSQTLGDKQLSDDLAQDTFIKAYVNIGKFEGRSSFSTWLYRIAFNVYYDYVRSNKITDDIDSPIVNLKNSKSANCELKLDLNNALAILSNSERVCISLQLIDGYSIDQIAEIVEMAEGTVKSHLWRGKKKLSTYLKENGYDGK